MTAAPVGFQCPDCIAQGNKGVRQAKTALGGEIRSRGDVLTKVLVGTNVLVWLLGMLIGTGRLSQEIFAASRGNIVWDEVTARFGLLMGSDDPFNLGVVDGEWYRLLTAAFVHEEFWHVGMNMFALWIIGSSLEPVLGRWRFASLYFLSALAGSVVSLMSGSDYQISIGASGAVYGLFGALFIVMRRLGRDVTFVLVILGVNLVLGFSVAGIDWRAHLGGLVVGTALAFAYAHAPREHRRTVSIVATGVALLVIVVATIVVVAAA